MTLQRSTKNAEKESDHKEALMSSCSRPYFLKVVHHLGMHHSAINNSSPEGREGLVRTDALIMHRSHGLLQHTEAWWPTQMDAEGGVQQAILRQVVASQCQHKVKGEDKPASTGEGWVEIIGPLHGA